MLQSFSLGNFLSFKDVQTLSMIPEGLKEQKENLHIPYLYNHEERLLKSVALYGHNSHGKSNFIKGFQFFQNLLSRSFSDGQLKNTIETDPFIMNDSMLTKPSYFEICFIIRETKYRYTVTLNNKEIIKEELHYAEFKIRENYLFKREGQEILISKNWNKENDNKVQQVIFFTKPHILFLSALLSQEKISRIIDVSNWLNSTMIIPDDYMRELTKARSIYSNPEYKNLIQKFIKKADIGFTTIFDKVENFSKVRPHIEKGLINMWYEKEMRDFELYTNHDVFNDEKEWVRNIELELLKSESAGSVKYFIIVSLLAYAIKNSQLVLVDELDAKFHSILLEMLVESFHSPNINPMNSQMIFTTHNTILLDKKLRRDQMVIIEKNEWGESHIERMHTSKRPIRVGKSIEKEYRQGKMGGTSKNLNSPELFD